MLGLGNLRERKIQTISRRLLRVGSPRLQMFLVVAGAGLVGFLASVVMLRLGLRAMWLRYPLAIGAAYGAFLAGIRKLVRSRLIVDAGIDESEDARYLAKQPPDFAKQSPEPRESSLIDALDLSLPDEGTPILLFLLMVGSALALSIYLVGAAPSLLAELLVDGLASAALYRGLKGANGGPDWMGAAFTATVKPALLMILGFALLGVVFGLYAPSASTLGEVLGYTPPPN